MKSKRISHEIFQEIFDAARADNVEELYALKNEGYDIAAANPSSLTALMIAAQEGSVKAARLLVESGANVNAKRDSGFTALIDAANKGQSVMVELLLAHGADINATTGGKNHTAAFWADEAGHYAIAALLRNPPQPAPLPEVRAEKAVKVMKPLTLRKSA